MQNFNRVNEGGSLEDKVDKPFIITNKPLRNFLCDYHHDLAVSANIKLFRKLNLKEVDFCE